MSDLYIDPKGQPYIDGHPIGRVTDLRVERDQRGTEVTITFFPDSVIFGDLPKAVVSEVLDAHTPVRNGVVDMQKAMENARLRGQGVNPVQPKTPTAQPARKTP